MADLDLILKDTKSPRVWSIHHQTSLENAPYYTLLLRVLILLHAKSRILSDTQNTSMHVYRILSNSKCQSTFNTWNQILSDVIFSCSLLGRCWEEYPANEQEQNSQRWLFWGTNWPRFLLSESISMLFHCGAVIFKLAAYCKQRNITFPHYCSSPEQSILGSHMQPPSTPICKQNH